MLPFCDFPRLVTVRTAFVLAEVGSRSSPANKKNAPRPKSVPKHSKMRYKTRVTSILCNRAVWGRCCGCRLWGARHIPVPAASQSRRTLPAGSSQAGSVFGCQGVGDDFLITHQFRNPGAPAVKEAAPIGNTIGAKPGHFRCFPIIQSAGNGAPNNRNSMNGVQIIYDSHTEFAAAHLSTVPVMRQNKRIGVPQGDR